MGHGFGAFDSFCQVGEATIPRACFWLNGHVERSFASIFIVIIGSHSAQSFLRPSSNIANYEIAFNTELQLLAESPSESFIEAWTTALLQ